MKNVPEMSLKLTCNDRVKARFTADGRQVTLAERLAIGGVSGALAQVLLGLYCPTTASEA